MTLTQHIAKHFREVHFGGNWTCVNIKEQLSTVSWQQATTKVHTFNTIATLTCHMSYYVDAVLKVLKGHPLNAHDDLSFILPPINNRQDWESILNKYWTDAEEFATLLEQLPDEKMWQNIADEKYGIYYRNIHGIIEHSHYHLGQIVFLKKLTT